MCSFFLSMVVSENRDLHLSGQFPAANRPTSSWIGEKQRERRRMSSTENMWWGTYQPPLGFDQRAILPVHLVIESAGVTQIVTRTVPPPQGGRRGPAVHTLSTFCKSTRARTHTHTNTHQMLGCITMGYSRSFQTCAMQSHLLS